MDTVGDYFGVREKRKTPEDTWAWPAAAESRGKCHGREYGNRHGQGPRGGRRGQITLTLNVQKTTPLGGIPPLGRTSLRQCC
jgi:hypothetical protein